MTPYQTTFDIFANQTIMRTIGAQLAYVRRGKAEIELPFREDLLQQGGFLHAGIITTIADTACGIAGNTLMSAGSGVLTIEYKVNFLTPAVGERFLAQGRAIRSGRTITVTQGDVWAVRDGRLKHIAIMQASMIAVRPSE